jgi:hypothetical protein
MMATMTYHVALAFMRSGDDGGEIVACDPKEARMLISTEN